MLFDTASHIVLASSEENYYYNVYTIYIERQLQQKISTF